MSCAASNSCKLPPHTSTSGCSCRYLICNSKRRGVALSSESIRAIKSEVTAVIPLLRDFVNPKFVSFFNLVNTAPSFVTFSSNAIITSCSSLPKSPSSTIMICVGLTDCSSHILRKAKDRYSLFSALYTDIKTDIVIMILLHLNISPRNLKYDL